VAFDLFTVPTVTFQLLYCFFVIEHGRRRIVHVQQLREAFADACPSRYAILDRDLKSDADVITFPKATGLKPKRTSVRAPWQNWVAERWVGGCRREILDHVIALNEQHHRLLVRDYSLITTKIAFTMLSIRTRRIAAWSSGSRLRMRS
jgi:hypothetical protein